MKKLWQWLLDCLAALADDDYNVDQKRRDQQDSLKRWLSYLGSGKS